MQTIIRLEIKKPAKRVGITKANQLAERTGLSLNTCYGMWNGETSRVDLHTLAILCDEFKCGIADILVKTKAKKEPHGSKEER